MKNHIHLQFSCWKKEDDERQKCNLDRNSKDVFSCPLLLQVLCLSPLSASHRCRECRDCRATRVAKKDAQSGSCLRVEEVCTCVALLPRGCDPRRFTCWAASVHPSHALGLDKSDHTRITWGHCKTGVISLWGVCIYLHTPHTHIYIFTYRHIWNYGGY